MVHAMMDLHYQAMVARHRGIFEDSEQARLLRSKVAIGGLGMGGSIFINLVRMGIGSFHISDLDVYEATNTNRQRLAKTSTVQRPKLDCLRDEAKDINPSLVLGEFPRGVTAENVAEFVAGCDLVVDTIDFFAFTEKLLLHRVAQQLGIPCVACFSVGFGGVCTTFPYHRGCASYEQVTGTSLDLDSRANSRIVVDWLQPIVPAFMRDTVELALQGRADLPFVVAGVEIAAAMAATATVEQLLHDRGIYAPEVMVLDPHRLDANQPIVRL